jgi:hypothetical protein
MAAFYFTFEQDWRTAPLAFWVHVPLASKTATFNPPAPAPVRHKGYPVLHVPFGRYDLHFSSGRQNRASFSEVIELPICNMLKYHYFKLQHIRCT